MIREILVPVLRDRFHERGLKFGIPPDPIAIFPAAHVAVGDVSIWDDGDEATLGIGDITHHHFNPYDSTLTEEAAARWITEEVVGFLEKLFADRVLLQKGRTSNWGSMEWFAEDEPIPPIRDGADAFLWSGPITSN